MTDTHRPTDVTFVWGPYLFTGFMDGEYISAEMNADGFAYKAGGSGDGSRILIPNESGRVKFVILSTSVVNSILTSAHRADRQGGDGIFPLAIADLSGADLIESEASWIVKPPIMKFAGEIQGREWILECKKLVLNAGGNAA